MTNRRRATAFVVVAALVATLLFGFTAAHAANFSVGSSTIARNQNSTPAPTPVSGSSVPTVAPIVVPTPASGVDVQIQRNVNVDDTLTDVRSNVNNLFASPDWPKRIMPQMPASLSEAVQPWLDLWGRIAGLCIILLTPAPMIYGWRRATGRTDDSTVRWLTNIFFTVLFLLAGPRLLGLLVDGIGIAGGALNRVVFGDEAGFTLALGQILTAATRDWQIVVLILGGILIVIWGWQIVVSVVGGLIKLALLLALSPLEAVRGRLREWGMEAGLVAAYLGLFYICALVLVRILSIPILLSVGSLAVIGGVWVLNDLPRRLAALWLGPVMENAARRRNLVSIVRDGLRPVVATNGVSRPATALGAAMLTDSPAAARRRTTVSATSGAPKTETTSEKSWFESAAAGAPMTAATGVRNATIANGTGLRPDVETIIRNIAPAVPVSGRDKDAIATSDTRATKTDAARQLSDMPKPRTFDLEEEVITRGTSSRRSTPAVQRAVSLAKSDVAVLAQTVEIPKTADNKTWLRANRNMRSSR